MYVGDRKFFPLENLAKKCASNKVRHSQTNDAILYTNNVLNNVHLGCGGPM